MYSRAEVQDIGYLSSTFRDRKCSDPRDHVYALLSLEETRELLNFRADYTIGEAELFVRLCLTRLSSWPRSWNDFLNGLELEYQTLSTSRLGERLLYEEEIFHQAVRIVIQRYNDKSSTRQQRKILTIIAAGFKLHPWSSDASSIELRDELCQIRSTRERKLRRYFQLNMYIDGVWWKPGTNHQRADGLAH